MTKSKRTVTLHYTYSPHFDRKPMRVLYVFYTRMRTEMEGRTIEVFEGTSRAARQALRLVTEGQVCLGFRLEGLGSRV